MAFNENYLIIAEVQKKFIVSIVIFRMFFSHLCPSRSQRAHVVNRKKQFQTNLAQIDI